MEQETRRKKIIKKVAVIFLVVLLILTFFSNTIMNYSLAEVSTETVSNGTVANKVRGQGIVEANSGYEVTVSGSRVIKEVKVEVGDKVEKDQVLFTFEEGEENSEWKQAQDELDEMELAYAKSLLKLLPDHYRDNLAIQSAKDELDAAIKAQEKAGKNDSALSKAKKEAAKAQKNVDAMKKTVDSLQEKVDAYGELGDYDAMVEQVESSTRELAAAKQKLADDKEDLAAMDPSEDMYITQERLIRDEEVDIQNKETDLKNLKAKAETLKSTSATYKQAKSDLDASSKELESLQTELSEKNAEVERLSAEPTAESAKADVKEKQNTLDGLLYDLQRAIAEEDLTQQQENLDMKADQEKIQKQKEKVEKLKKSDDLKEVKAKEEGIVTSIDCKAGDTVTAELPLANVQLEDAGYIVKITVNKQQSKLIKVGSEATVGNGYSYGGEETTATVKSIKADPENPNQNMVVTFEVKGDVDVGQEISISAGEKSNRYDSVVPNNAIREDSKGKFVLVVTVKGTPLGNRYTVKRADIEVLAQDDTSSGVSGGVYQGDNVVTNSSKPLEDGIHVRLVD